MKPEDLGHGKQNRIASRLYTKDWEYTDDRDVDVEMKQRKLKKTTAGATQH